MKKLHRIALILLSLIVTLAPACGGGENDASKLAPALYNGAGLTDTPVYAVDSGNSTANTGDYDFSDDHSSGPLPQESLDTINDEAAKAGISAPKVTLNLRVTVPAWANTQAEEDCDLWSTLIRPDTDEKLPTILVATPYRREIMMILYLSLVNHGYNLMVVDIRGTGSSAGNWTSFDLIEQYDTKYVIDDFIPAQEWSDGKVGMIGPSYMAIIQTMVAGLIDRDEITGEPTHLKALFPLVPMTDAYRDIVMQGGNIDLEFIPMWLGIVDILGALPGILNLGEDGKPNLANIQEATDIWKAHIANIPVSIDWIMDSAHLNDGPFFDKKSSMIYWPQKPAGGWGFYEGDNYTIPAKLPVFTTGGWFDIFTRGTTNFYQYGLRDQSASDKKLIMGEVYHLGGSLGLGLDSVMSGELPARWFDWKIKGENDPFMEEYPVLLYVMGEKKWRAEKSWPLPPERTEDQTLYLTKNAPTPVPGDWYTDEPWWHLIKYYADNNYGLSDAPNFSGDNPVLNNNPLYLTGLISRSTTRWMMGMPALVSQISKHMLDKDIDENMPFEDERFDEKTVQTFTSEPLDEDREIIGPLTLTFWAKTSFPAPLSQLMLDGVIDMLKGMMNVDSNLILDAMKKKDVQWVVEVNDVYEDGRARNITSGWLSAAHRQYDPTGRENVYYTGPWWHREKVVEHAVDPDYTPFDPFYDGPDKNPKPIKENELYQYTVELWPTCNVFKKGLWIRVSLSASDFPHLLPILIPSKNTIVIDSDHLAQLDYKTTTGAGEGETWKWIGSRRDADDYLMSGASTGCGNAADAADFTSRKDYLLSGILGTLFMMLFPLGMIFGMRIFRRSRSYRV